MNGLTDGRARTYGPGTEQYAAATRPRNTSGAQRPALVATPMSAAEVVEAVREAARRGLRIVPQATGHGAAGDLGEDSLLLDTSSLTALDIEAESRLAHAGSGLTWGRVNAAAERHGLLGLAGSASSVSISGYTFGGGIGWLTRPHGLASAALRRVEYVTGDGAIRVAAEDAEDALDRDALWAFRGGGGVGVATRLDFDLVPVADLHAGYLLWPIDALDPVVSAWSSALPELGADVGTSIAVLHVPPAPPFPETLRGTTVVHLAVAANEGARGARPLIDAVRRAAPPLIDTWGSADAAKLAGIHLDPVKPAPTIGVARWLTADAPDLAADMLAVAALPDSPVAMLEVRSIGHTARPVPGALTIPPGPFVVHAVGPLRAPDSRTALDAVFTRLREVAVPIDAGHSVGS